MNTNTHRTIADLLIARSNNFDILRFIAASMVIVSHAYPLSLGKATETQWQEPLKIFTQGQMTFGTLGVAIFFVISGFLIYQSFDHSKNVLVYTKSRLLRIFPALIVVLLLAAFVLGPLVTQLPLDAYFTDKQTYGYLQTVFLYPVYFNLPGVFENNIWGSAVNGSLWTIPYEFFCYVLVAIAGLIGIFKHRAILLGLLIFVIYFRTFGMEVELFQPILGRWIGGVNVKGFINLSSYFLAGMVIYAYRDKIILHRGLAYFSLFMLLTASFLGGLKISFIIFGSYLTMYLAFSPEMRCHQFGKFGDFSYGMYIYAFPVQQLTTYYHGGTMSPINNFLISFPITLVFAILSWHLIEKHALKLKKVVFIKKLKI